ncbi:MAG: hypothetical protein JW910_13780 [Anaerolineae bacterium]|nr:hypothetical protein [Anaerolineae bacterium]
MKSEHRILLIAILFGLALWVLDAVLDAAAFFTEVSFWDVLIALVPPSVIYDRGVMLIACIAFGLVLMRAFSMQRKTREALQRANRAYRTLSDCNQAVVRATEPQRLLQQVCDILVSIG